jgi:hypothetical protein
MVCECELHRVLHPLVFVRVVCYFRLKAVFYGVFGALGGNFDVLGGTAGNVSKAGPPR